MAELSDITLADWPIPNIFIKESRMDRKIACIDESDIMPDVVLHYLADKFTREVLPYIKDLRLDRYLTCPAFFDDVAGIMKREGTFLFFREGFSLIVQKETVHWC